MTPGPSTPIPGPPVIAHVADATPPVGFLQFWSAWHDRVWGADAELVSIAERDVEGVGASGVTHLVASVGGVRIGCRVAMPKQVVCGAIIELHGYDMISGAPLRSATGFADRGLCHVAVRVRGFPGSQLDAGDLLCTPGGYVTLGLSNASEWVVGQAVADVVSVYRALRRMYGPELPISIRGESFGGALAILAASAISSRDAVHRVAVGVPSLGDWAWRLAHPEFSGGAGEQLLRAIPPDAAGAAEVLRTLRLFDVVVHARRVTCPVIFKMAYSDPIVAPATTAAIYNALGSGAGWKWRFMTSYAHMDASVRRCSTDELRRHALFERLCEEFLDPREYPQSLMKRWEAQLDTIRPTLED